MLLLADLNFPTVGNQSMFPFFSILMYTNDLPFVTMLALLHVTKHIMLTETITSPFQINLQKELTGAHHYRTCYEVLLINEQQIGQSGEVDTGLHFFLCVKVFG